MLFHSSLRWFREECFLYTIVLYINKNYNMLKRLKEIFLLGAFTIVPKYAAWFLVALLCCCYSERLNGANVDTKLAGDWILVAAAVSASLAVASLTVTVLEENKTNKDEVIDEINDIV